MAKYLYIRIEDGALEYDAVVAKYPQYKSEIDLMIAGQRVNSNVTRRYQYYWQVIEFYQKGVK